MGPAIRYILGTVPGYIVFPQWLQSEIIPGLPFRWYGLMYLVAFALTYVLFQYQVKNRKLEVERDTTLSFFFWGIIGLLIGARIFATLFFSGTDLYWRRPWLIFWPFNEQGQFTGFQGMNYYGGLVGAVAGFVLYAKRKKLPILDWGDMLVAGIPLAYTFGRLGNFINGELYGRVTTAAWGVVFPHAQQFPASEPWVQEKAAAVGMDISGLAMVNLPRHPTQLYEAITEGIISWLVIWFLLRKRRPFHGFLVAVYVLSYGIFRFFIDYFRMPLAGDFALRLSPIENPPYLLLTPWNFIMSQFYSFAMIAAGVIMLVAFRAYHKKRELAAATETHKPSRRKTRKKLSK